jgi:hypothetical protein
MIKYRVNNKFVDEETFYAELKKYYDATHQPFTYTSYLEKLKTDGCSRLDGKAITYEYNYFYVADEQVFDLAQIVAENEYDPLDDDFAIAFAIYQKGFRKQKE